MRWKLMFLCAWCVFLILYTSVCVCSCRCAWTWARSQVVWDRKLQLWFLYNAEADTRPRRRQQPAEQQTTRESIRLIQIRVQNQICGMNAAIINMRDNGTSTPNILELRFLLIDFDFIWLMLKGSTNAAYWNLVGSKRNTLIVTGCPFKAIIVLHSAKSCFILLW